MIEHLAAGMVRHRSTAHENLAMTIRDRLDLGHSGERSGAAETLEEIPRELQEALTLDSFARHYRKWLDEPIPALSEHTPRQTAKLTYHNFSEVGEKS
jgi:hypothetical protein